MTAAPLLRAGAPAPRRHRYTSGDAAPVEVEALGGALVVRNGDRTLLRGDRFVYAGGDGLDAINGFTVGEDVIQVAAGINGTGIDSAEGLLGRLSETDAGVVVDLGTDNAILLSGLTLAVVTAGGASAFEIG